MPLESYDALLRSILTLRNWQKEYNKAFRNPDLRQEIIAQIRLARTNANANHDALNHDLRDAGDGERAEELTLYRQYRRVRDLNRTYYELKLDSARKDLRDQEKKLDALIKAIIKTAAQP